MVQITLIGIMVIQTTATETVTEETRIGITEAEEMEETGMEITEEQQEINGDQRNL